MTEEGCCVEKGCVGRELGSCMEDYFNSQLTLEIDDSWMEAVGEDFNKFGVSFDDPEVISRDDDDTDTILVPRCTQSSITPSSRNGLIFDDSWMDEIDPSSNKIADSKHDDHVLKRIEEEKEKCDFGATNGRCNEDDKLHSLSADEIECWRAKQQQQQQRRSANTVIETVVDNGSSLSQSASQEE